MTWKYFHRKAMEVLLSSHGTQKSYRLSHGSQGLTTHPIPWITVLQPIPWIMRSYIPSHGIAEVLHPIPWIARSYNPSHGSRGLKPIPWNREVLQPIPWLTVLQPIPWLTVLTTHPMDHRGLNNSSHGSQDVLQPIPWIKGLNNPSHGSKRS